MFGAKAAEGSEPLGRFRFVASSGAREGECPNSQFHYIWGLNRLQALPLACRHKNDLRYQQALIWQWPHPVTQQRSAAKTHLALRWLW